MSSLDNQVATAINGIMGDAYKRGLAGKPDKLFPDANIDTTPQEVHDMATAFLDEYIRSKGFTGEQCGPELYQWLLYVTKMDISEYMRGLADRTATHNHNGEGSA